MGLEAIGMETLFTATEIVSATGGRLMRGDPAQTVPGLSIDSRTIRPGQLFLAIRGERFDGHQFVYDALGRGACGVVVNVSVHRIPKTAEEEALLRGKILIGVTDTLAALQELARFHRQRWSLPVIAVTGSNGKTTTKEMAAGILTERYVTLKNEGNLNNQIGVPLTLLRLTARHQAAVLEMGISRAGELRRLCEVAIPRVGLITNIGPTHLETLGSLDGVASAKAELLASLSPSEGVAILNRDDPFYAALRSRAPGRVVTFGLGPDADVSAEGIQETDTLTRMGLSWDPSVLGIGRPAARSGRGSGRTGKEGPGSVGSDRTRIAIHLPTIGLHNALNAAAACAAGLILGCEPEEIKRGLEVFRPVTMRSEIIGWDGRTLLYDVYNANPASVQAALEMLSRFSGQGRRIAVLGDMLELGAAATDAHRQIGRAVASSGIHALITLGNLGAVIAEEARAQGLDRNRVRVCQDPSEAAQTLKEMTESGDVILLKGSRGMRMERILDHLSIKR